MSKSDFVEVVTAPLAIDGAQATPVALILPKAIEPRFFLELGKNLRRIQGASLWWIADYILYAQEMAKNPDQPRKSRSEVYNKVLAIFPRFERNTLKTYAWVARSIPPEMRSESLSFTHHVQIASLAEENPELRKPFIRKAEELECTAEELRLMITDTRHGQRMPSPKKPMAQKNGSGTEQVAASDEDRRADVGEREPEVLANSHAQLASDLARTANRLAEWYRSEGKKHKAESWPKDRREALLRDLQPAIEAMHRVGDIIEGLANSRESGNWA